MTTPTTPNCSEILLEEEGHETYMAHDGVEGLAAAERLRPDVVFMDLGLPRIDGFDACRRIREQPWGKGILMIAIPAGDRMSIGANRRRPDSIITWSSPSTRAHCRADERSPRRRPRSVRERDLNYNRSS